MTITGTSSGSPLVSIGVPTFNRAMGLDRALRSILAQDYQNIEIVISDNGSTDETEAVCRNFAERDRRIRYLRQPLNHGPAINFRLVLKESRGEFFMWLGDDDWLDLGYISKCTELLRADSAFTVVCGCDRYYENGAFVGNGSKMNLDDDSGVARVISYYRQVTRNGAFYGVMRRDLISKIPMYEVLAGDWLVVAAMAYLGKIRTVDGVWVHRSLGGASRDWASLALIFGLSEFQEANPGLTIASNVFSNIRSKSPVYSSLGRRRRLALAAQAFYAVASRYYSPRHVFPLARQLIRASSAHARRSGQVAAPAAVRSPTSHWSKE